VWELKQIQFDYFFFDENCSYRLLELLQVARPSLDLTSQFPLTAIPTDTVKAVKQSGLVASETYRPSRERELLARAEPLDHNEKRQVLAASADTAQLQSAEFKALPLERQALVQDAAYRLERYRPMARNATPARQNAASSCCVQSTATHRRPCKSNAPACPRMVMTRAPGSWAWAPVKTVPTPNTACAWPTTT
jgi:hypothetical protein